jgi:hypothetical protein
VSISLVRIAALLDEGSGDTEWVDKMKAFAERVLKKRVEALPSVDHRSRAGGIGPYRDRNVRSIHRASLLGDEVPIGSAAWPLL